MKNTRTVELLSCPQTSGDLWTEIYKEDSPNNFILSFIPDSTYTMRLLGPFISARRLYIPHSNVSASFVNSKQIEDIRNGNEKLYDEIMNKIKESLHQMKPPKRTGKDIGKLIDEIDSESDFVDFRCPEPVPPSMNRRGQAYDNISLQEYEQLIGFLKALKRGSGWQKHILVNALIRSSNVSLPLSSKMVIIVPLIKRLCQSIFNAVGSSNIKINGLYAHDLTVRKSGRGLQTRYDVQLSRTPSHLPIEDVNQIFATGLLDIPSVIRDYAKNKFGGYMYKMNSDYKMSEEFFAYLEEEFPVKDEAVHFQRVEENINNLPEEAFENRINVNDAIGSLDI